MVIRKFIRLRLSPEQTSEGTPNIFDGIFHGSQPNSSLLESLMPPHEIDGILLSDSIPLFVATGEKESGCSFTIFGSESEPGISIIFLRHVIDLLLTSRLQLNMSLVRITPYSNVFDLLQPSNTAPSSPLDPTTYPQHSIPSIDDACDLISKSLSGSKHVEGHTLFSIFVVSVESGSPTPIAHFIDFQGFRDPQAPMIDLDSLTAALSPSASATTPLSPSSNTITTITKYYASTPNTNIFVLFHTRTDEKSASFDRIVECARELSSFEQPRPSVSRSSPLSFTSTAPSDQSFSPTTTVVGQSKSPSPTPLSNPASIQSTPTHTKPTIFDRPQISVNFKEIEGYSLGSKVLSQSSLISDGDSKSPTPPPQWSSTTTTPRGSEQQDEAFMIIMLLEEKKEGLVADIARIEREFADRQMVMQREFSELTEQVHRMRSTREQYKVDEETGKTAILADITLHKRLVSELKEAVCTLQEERKTLLESVTKERERLSDLQQKNSDSQQEVGRLESRCQCLREELLKVESGVENARSEHEEYLAKIQNAKVEKQVSEQELIQQKAELQSLSQEVATARSLLKDFSDHTNLKQDIHDLSSQQEVLKSSVELLTNELSELVSKKSEMEHSVFELKERCGEIVRDIQKWEVQRGEANVKAHEAETKLLALQSQFDLLSNQLSDLQTKEIQSKSQFEADWPKLRSVITSEIENILKLDSSPYEDYQDHPVILAKSKIEEVLNSVELSHSRQNPIARISEVILDESEWTSSRKARMDLETAVAESDTLKAKIRGFREEIARLEMRKSDLEFNVDHLVSKESRLNGEISALMAQRAETDQQVEASRSALSLENGLTMRMQALRRQHEIEVGQLSRESERMRSEQASSAAELSRLESEKSLVSKNLQILAEGVNEEQKKLRSVEMKTRKVSDAFASLEADVHQLEAQKAAILGEVKSLGELESKAASLKYQIAKLSEEAESAKKEKTKATEAAEKATAVLKEATAKARQTDEESHKMSTDAKIQLETAIRERAQLESEAAMFKKQRERDETELSKLKTEHSQLAMRVEMEKQALMKQMSEEILKLTNDRIEMTREHDKTREKLIAVQSELAEEEKKKETVVKDKDVALAEAIRLREMMVRLIQDKKRVEDAIAKGQEGLTLISRGPVESKCVQTEIHASDAGVDPWSFVAALGGAAVSQVPTVLDSTVEQLARKLFETKRALETHQPPTPTPQPHSPAAGRRSALGRSSDASTPSSAAAKAKTLAEIESLNSLLSDLHAAKSAIEGQAAHLMQRASSLQNVVKQQEEKKSHVQHDLGILLEQRVKVQHELSALEKLRDQKVAESQSFGPIRVKLYVGDHVPSDSTPHQAVPTTPVTPARDAVSAVPVSGEIAAADSDLQALSEMERKLQAELGSLSKLTQFRSPLSRMPLPIAGTPPFAPSKLPISPLTPSTPTLSPGAGPSQLTPPVANLSDKSSLLFNAEALKNHVDMLHAQKTIREKELNHLQRERVKTMQDLALLKAQREKETPPSKRYF